MRRVQAPPVGAYFFLALENFWFESCVRAVSDIAELTGLFTGGADHRRLMQVLDQMAAAAVGVLAGRAALGFSKIATAWAFPVMHGARPSLVVVRWLQIRIVAGSNHGAGFVKHGIHSSSAKLSLTPLVHCGILDPPACQHAGPDAQPGVDDASAAT